MSNIYDERKKVLESFIRGNSFDIAFYISKTTSKEWLEIALNENVFDIVPWKKCGNTSGFIEVNQLIKKYGDEIGYNATLEKVLKTYLSFDHSEYYLIVSDIIDFYLKYDLIKDLIYKLNIKLIMQNDKICSYVRRVYTSLIQEIEFSDENKNMISSVYGNSIILGNPFDELKYTLEQYDTLVDIVDEKMTSKLDMLKRIDCMYKDVFTTSCCKLDLSRVTYRFDSDFYIIIEINEINYSNDYLYSDVDQWINKALARPSFMRRNYYSKLLNLYFQHQKNETIIKELIDSDSVYYKKIGFNYLNIYFGIDFKVEILSNITQYASLLNDLSISNVLCNIIDGCFHSLKGETLSNIKKAFNQLNEKNLEGLHTLIRAYNFLKKDYEEDWIDLPQQFKSMMPVEAIGKVEVGYVNEISYLDDSFIVDNFEESIIYLNDIYLNRKTEEVDKFVEKTYRATSKKILELAHRNDYVIKEDFLDKLHTEVIADFVDLIDDNDQYEKVIEKMFLRLHLLKNESQNIYPQINLSRAIKTYIKKCKESHTLNWDYVYSEILKFSDFLEPIKLDNYNSYCGEKKYQDLIILYINSATYELIETLFILADKDLNRIESVYSLMLTHKESLLMIASLAYYYNDFVFYNVNMELTEILSDNSQKEMFLCIFVLSNILNEAAASNIQFLFYHFIFDCDLLCNDENVYEKMGQMIYLVYENTELYNSLVNEIFNEFTNNKNRKLEIVLRNILWMSIQKENQKKQYCLLLKLYQIIGLGNVPIEFMKFGYDLVKCIGLNKETIRIASQFTNLLASTEFDYEVYKFYEWLVEQNVDELISCDKRELRNQIFNKLKQLNSYYCKYIHNLEDNK